LHLWSSRTCDSRPPRAAVCILGYQTDLGHLRYMNCPQHDTEWTYVEAHKQSSWPQDGSARPASDWRNSSPDRHLQQDSLPNAQKGSISPAFARLEKRQEVPLGI